MRVGQGESTSSAHVNVSTQWLNQYGTFIGSYSFQTYIHEIGHALGLGHAGNYNVTATYPYDAVFRNDSWASSVMSYFDPTENTYTASLGFTGNELVTPMVADIIAISQMYGLSTTTRTGDTTYGFHSTAGEPWFDAIQFSNVAYTIYDSGGIDTLDYSGITLNQLINLNPETFSNVGANVGNVSIARGVVIENAIGGWGDDTLIGNSANNVLDGGPGFNTISYAWSTAAVTVDTSIVGPQNTGGAGVDTLLNYVRLDGSSFDDTLIGRDGTANQQVGLHGEGGNDTLIASADGDNLYGDAGNDTLIGGASRDILDGGDGNDIFLAGNGSDTIYAGNGNDTITGGLGVDFFVGGAGVDTFIDTTAGLNGDTISDLEAGERIVITDDILSSFAFSVSGNTLNFTGGSLTFNAFFFGHWAYDAAPGGGVEIWKLNQNDHHPANDFSGDGRSDVLWRSDTGELTNWLGSGPGGFSPNGANAYTIVPTSWHIVGTGDFNGGGRDDILWRNDDGTITDWIANANGNGGFGASTTFSTMVSNAWHVVGVGDFNGDTRDDILWRNDDGTITDWLSNANGTFSASTTFSTYVPTDWHVVGTGDFNGDGRDDILWRNDSGQLTDWLRTANGSFLSNVFSVYVPTDWSVAATGDFNGDGYIDVLWRQDTGQLTDWLGSASGALVDNGANASIFVPANWQVVSVGDFNGDTRDDILWRDANGQLTEWLGTANGGFTDNSANAATFVPTNWHVVNLHRRRRAWRSAWRSCSPHRRASSGR